MARSHAKVLVQVWRDRDWTSLSIEAQWLYWLLLSQPKLTLVGSLEVTPGRWAAFAPNGSKAVVDAALIELEDAGKVIVDPDTDELLIRTFTTHDLDANRVNVNLARGLWGQWACIASDALRRFAVLLIPDATWEKLEQHAPSDATYIRRSAQLEPGEAYRLRPQPRPRFEPPPSSHLPTDTPHPPGSTCSERPPVDNPFVAQLVRRSDVMSVRSTYLGENNHAATGDIVVSSSPLLSSEVAG